MLSSEINIEGGFPSKGMAGGVRCCREAYIYRTRKLPCLQFGLKSMYSSSSLYDRTIPVRRYKLLILWLDKCVDSQNGIRSVEDLLGQFRLVFIVTQAALAAHKKTRTNTSRGGGNGSFMGASRTQQLEKKENPRHKSGRLGHFSIKAGFYGGTKYCY